MVDVLLTVYLLKLESSGVCLRSCTKGRILPFHMWVHCLHINSDLRGLTLHLMCLAIIFDISSHHYKSCICTCGIINVRHMAGLITVWPI